MGSDELFVPVEPKFWVVFACVRSAVAGHAALPNHTLGHPMLRLGPAALPTFVSALIQQQSETPSAAMGCLLEHRDEVASWFAVHGALLATIKLSDLRVALFAASGKNKAIKGGLNALAARLVGKAHSRSASNTSTWLPLATKIRASLPTQLPDATPSPTKITAAHAVPVLEVKAPCHGAPDKVQVHVELSTSTPEVDVPPPFDPHYCDSDDEEQQNAGVHWLLRSAASEGAEAATIETNCHGTSLNLVAVRNNDRTAGDKAACKWLQDLLHPYTANMQIKPDFVRWLWCATDPSIRLPTMAGESKPGYVDTDGRAVYQLAAYLMYLVRMFRLVDPDPVVVGRLWHGKHLQYFTMALGTTASGDRRYMLTPWGSAFDMSAPQGRADAVQRERACMSYCRSMEVKLGPVMAMLVAMKAKADDPEFDAADPDDRVPLTREPLKPCTWWHFPASWPAFMRAELRHRGYSRCRLLKTSHNVAVFHGTDSASQQAVCIKVYGAKPVQMLTSYRALAKTAFRHAVMQVLTDFDTVWGHVVVARWEDGVTLDHIGDARLPEVVAEMVVDLCARRPTREERAAAHGARIRPHERQGALACAH